MGEGKKKTFSKVPLGVHCHLRKLISADKCSFFKDFFSFQHVRLNPQHVSAIASIENRMPVSCCGAVRVFRPILSKEERKVRDDPLHCWKGRDSASTESRPFLMPDDRRLLSHNQPPAIRLAVSVWRKETAACQGHGKFEAPAGRQHPTSQRYCPPGCRFSLAGKKRQG